MGTDEANEARSSIDRWREYAVAHGTAGERVAEIEGRLREHAATLGAAGLDADEAFLVALRRVAASDPISREFAGTLSAELWVSPAPVEGESEQAQARGATVEFVFMLACAAAAAIAIKVPMLFGHPFQGQGAELYMRNLSLFALPFLAIYFAWKRRLSGRAVAGLAAAFAAAAVFANAYPFVKGAATEILTGLHLPVALWLAVGVAYAGGDWRSGTRRMEYARFTGEWFVDYALIALGGGVLLLITTGVFGMIGVDTVDVIGEWVLPIGAMGAVVVAAWLVGARRNPAGGMAPMLARVFTPLFALMLIALLVGIVWTKGFIDIEREVLIFLDLLLVVVVALVLYGVSARDPGKAPALFDRIQLVLVACALAVDVFALVNIAARLADFGFSANRTAGLGLNIVLLVNLAWSAFLLTGFLRGKRPFADVEAWQMRYLPVYAIWAAIVVVAFPPLFRFY